MAGVALQACSSAATGQPSGSSLDVAEIPAGFDAAANSEEIAARKTASGSGDAAIAANGSVRASVVAALGHSAALRRAQADLSTAGVGVDIAYAGYQPSLQSTGGFGTDDTFDYRFTLAQPLYDWGRTGAEVGRAKAQNEAAQAELEDTRDKTALEAAAAHIAVKRSERLVAVAEENLTVYKRFTTLARDRTSGGVGDATEVELAGVHQGAAESALQDARGALRSARSVYHSLVGTEPRDLAAVPELPLALGKSIDPDAAAAEAPAVKAARARQEAARQAARSEQAGLLPRLSAEAFVRGDDGSDEARTGVGLRLTGPTVVGLSNFRKVEAARLQAESAKWAAEAARRDARLEVTKLFDREPTLRSRIRTLGVQLEKARALRDLYEDQFKIGERQLADLVNVQADIVRFETSLANARFDILDLQYAAAAAVGSLLETLQLAAAGDAR